MDNEEWPDIVLEDILDDEFLEDRPIRRGQGLRLIAEDYNQETGIWRSRTIG